MVLQLADFLFRQEFCDCRDGGGVVCIQALGTPLSGGALGGEGVEVHYYNIILKFSTAVILYWSWRMN